jgi:hypothetical protein
MVAPPQGVCTLELGPDMTCSFPSLGIQCVKKKGKKSEFIHRDPITFLPEKL